MSVRRDAATAPRGKTCGPRRRRPMHRLQTRLLFWFLGAIVLAIGASAVTTVLTSSDPGDTPTRVVSRHVQRRLSTLWDDPVATDAYIDQLRDTTGLDMRVRRDPAVFAHARPGRGGMIFEEGVAYVPVVRHGTVVGALELRTGSPAPQLSRVAAALVAALVVLGAVARRVSKRIARPLEHLAATADRFGGGDLSARTGIDKLPRRWVAEEVRDVGRAFDEMAGRIERVVLDQRDLLAAISHELRSPLGRARVALEIARERGGATAIDDVDRQLVEIDAILGDLLASARTGLADLRGQVVALVPWLRQRIAESGGNIELVVSEDAEDARVFLDPALFARALHNVLANARSHGHPEALPIEVDLRIAEGRARIAVRDRGPGFAESMLPRAFEPFVTGRDPARSPSSAGLGLGLTLVQRIVEAHGGGVMAANVEEGGAEISLEIPLRPSSQTL